jgi:hypothetical protein
VAVVVIRIIIEASLIRVQAHSLVIICSVAGLPLDLQGPRRPWWKGSGGRATSHWCLHVFLTHFCILRSFGIVLLHQSWSWLDIACGLDDVESTLGGPTIVYVYARCVCRRLEKNKPSFNTILMCIVDMMDHHGLG